MFHMAGVAAVSGRSLMSVAPAHPFTFTQEIDYERK